jgi:hypothetical protein
MNKYHVVLAVARGACLDIGRKIRMTIVAATPLMAAIVAENLANQTLGEVEYAHAQQVKLLQHAPALALAA